MIAHKTIPKLQIQSQVLSYSDLSCSKLTCFNVGINTLKVHKYDPSDLDPHTSCLQNHTKSVTSLSYDFEPEITMHTSKKIIILNNIDHDLSAGLNTDQENSQVSRKKFIINSSCHDSEKVDEKQKLSSQPWLRISVDILFIFSR